MKRIVFALITAIVTFLFIGCDFNASANDISYGTYVLEQIETNTISLPSVTISDESIAFTYDCLSSYLPIGKYKTKDKILVMTTNDQKYKYVFLIDDNKLIFKKDESSEVKFTDDRFGNELKDNAIFRLKD